VLKLGGQPFDNATRVYTGSLDDDALNAGVAHFSASQSALDQVQAFYQTGGQLRAPLVTLHTTLDPIVPYWHEPLYRSKVVTRGRTPRYDEYPPGARYGHCNFRSAEVLAALALLVSRVENPPPVDVNLSDGYNRSAHPLSTVLYTHTLTNTGSLSTTFDAQVSSSQWAVALMNGSQPTSTLSVPLGSGMTTTLLISLSVPAGASGQSAHVALTATAHLSPGIFMAVADTVAVLYPLYLPVVLR